MSAPRKMLFDGEKGNPATVVTVESYDFDLFVIGAGSGGVRAARTSAGFGVKVAICELPFNPISSEVTGGVGGTCVIRGCVPKKILVYGAQFGGEFEDARNFGWELNDHIDFNWKKLLHNKTKEIERLNGVYKRLLSNAGVTLFEGEGRLVSSNIVEVTQSDGSKQKYSTKNVLIATGSRAQRVNIPGQELAITSDEALSLDELPKRVVILGAGYIAVEFASIWRGMGSEVDLVYRKELPLRGFDDEMRELVARNLEGRGIRLHPGKNLLELSKIEKGIKAVTDHGDVFIADTVLFATGRLPNTKRLNLQAVGVELDKTELSRFESRDCCIPSLSVVGLSEQQAVDQGKVDILVFTSTFNPMKNTISGRQERTVMKLVVDSETDKVLGASMCGPDAAEIMQGIAVALKCGVTKAQLDSTVGIHPSAAEEFVTMRTLTRRVPAAKPKTSL
ncbi:hypothetical protein HPP92_010494 [Vanilla planifolia]|uniref:glutathione-disulfide reductase n=1 Tax=Vanilla planifolia TaxID=51239 RepID=A0A835V3I3_VANPL|nr:hypothetical protein HPP92_010494 [Vanilla planifolia]